METCYLPKLVWDMIVYYRWRDKIALVNLQYVETYAWNDRLEGITMGVSLVFDKSERLKGEATAYQCFQTWGRHPKAKDKIIRHVDSCKYTIKDLDIELPNNY